MIAYGHRHQFVAAGCFCWGDELMTLLPILTMAYYCCWEAMSAIADSGFPASAETA